ncbi:MAG: hypothetical protein WA886_22580, partial [Candidatus Acidiferrales bacterium]
VAAVKRFNAEGAEVGAQSSQRTAKEKSQVQAANALTPGQAGAQQAAPLRTLCAIAIVLSACRLGGGHGPPAAVFNMPCRY